MLGENGEALESVFGPLLAHETRRWNAAEENSRRLAQRASLLLTSVVAFLAVGLFRFGLDSLGGSLDLPGAWSPNVGLAIRILIVVGLLSILIGSAYVVGVFGARRASVVPRDAQRQASAYLDLARDPIPLRLEVPEHGTPEYYRFRAYVRTREAANHLEGRNAIERWRLDRGQRLYGIGFALIFLAIGAYAVIPREEGVGQPALADPAAQTAPDYVGLMPACDERTIGVRYRVWEVGGTCAGPERESALTRARCSKGMRGRQREYAPFRKGGRVGERR